MSAYGLQTLLVTAVTDWALRARLLADAPTAYSPFELSAAEIAGLRNIRASTLEEYARQAHCLFYGEDPLTGEPITAALPRRQRCVERALG
jgi:hypothetical protein